ncbi:unnamed protein product, partial [Meganyctiphanes norvegica]
AFKTKNIPFIKETESKVCKLHQKTIGHRCLKCQMWICGDCLDNHSNLIGCSTISAPDAVSSMKEEHTKSVDRLLACFELGAKYVSSKINENSTKRKELLDKVKKLGEDDEKLQNLLEQGNIHKEKLEESNSHLKETNSPFEIMDKIEMLTQRKQALRSWSVKTLGSDSPIGFLKTLKEEKDAYIEMIDKDIKKTCQIITT